MRVRGYLLLDVFIGAALAAVIVSILFQQVAAARRSNTAATRDVVATQLLLEKLEQQRSLPYASFANGTANEMLAGGYHRQTVVTTGSAVKDVVGTSPNQRTLFYAKIAVTVKYPCLNPPNCTTAPPGEKVRATQATTRVYQ